MWRIGKIFAHVINLEYVHGDERNFHENMYPLPFQQFSQSFNGVNVQQNVFDRCHN